MSRFTLAVLLCFSLAASAAAQTPDVRAEWNAPVEPFRIFGPLYYVGTKEVASFAIKTPKGLVILDGGLPESAPRIVESLENLGLRIQDAKILLNSHSHFDHAGGLAELKEKSGAQMMASERDTAQLEAGGKGDFAWGDANLFPAVKVDRKLRDGDTVSLGGITLTAHVTAGHTKGCTTWTATFEEKGESLRAVFYCSTSVPDPENYRLAGNPRYPEIAADYEKSFAFLRDLPCDLFLAAHGSFFDLEKKAARLRAGDRHAFVDPKGFRSYVEQSEKRFRELLGQARAKAKP
ncbi:MAG TPA: subclass B3 metallo-beta-lactamase [Thermoanaerobaculia bacterium]|jgi:metallo-beta-lactamase class B|nr:subclass B3 metallo-beta-lactamase [Thermoanaerobaculia bacterium]